MYIAASYFPGQSPLLVFFANCFVTVSSCGARHLLMRSLRIRHVPRSSRKILRTPYLRATSLHNKRSTLLSASSNQRLPIFPGSRPPSIFGVCELNFCVRDGNRWNLTAIVTGFLACLFTEYLRRCFLACRSPS